MTERLARHAALHPKRMVAIWAAIFVLSIAAIALLLPSAITTDAHVTNNPESEQGYAAHRQACPSFGRLRQRGRRLPGARQGRDEGPGRAPGGRAARGGAGGDRSTYRVTTTYSSNDASLVSRDRDATVLTIGMGRDAEDGIKDVIAVVERADEARTR